MKKWMKNRILYRVSIVLALALFTLWIPMGFSNHNINYDFVESFDVLFDQLKEHYVLGEYRETDWDGLYETYIHGMKMAEEERSDTGETGGLSGGIVSGGFQMGMWCIVSGSVPDCTAGKVASYFYG